MPPGQCPRESGRLAIHPGQSFFHRDGFSLGKMEKPIPGKAIIFRYPLTDGRIRRIFSEITEKAKEGAMKKDEKKEMKKATYEKPVLIKYKKLTDVVGGASPNGS